MTMTILGIQLKILFILFVSSSRVRSAPNIEDLILSNSSEEDLAPGEDYVDEGPEEHVPEGPEINPQCLRSDWPKLFPTCAGLQQSPVNIKATNLHIAYRPVASLCWNNYDAIPISTTLINAGHTIEMRGKWKENEVPSVSCGALKDRVYEFVQWHCHWARNNHNGSEHTFNGRPYPMECHFVHYRKDYGSFREAALQEDGLLVVAVVYDIKSPATFPADVLGSALLRLATQNNVSVMPLPLGVYAPTFADKYVMYRGSLTTPPCSESVIWIINVKAQNISRVLMKKFRYVAKTSECMINNFRTIQELNGRDVLLVNNLYD